MSENPDILCLLETRIKLDQLKKEVKPDTLFNDYYTFWNCSTIKKGYSGVALLSKYEPSNVFYGIKEEEFDLEGRVVTLEFNQFHLVTVYAPNSGVNLKRLKYRLKFDEKLLAFVKTLNAIQKKNIILAGDFNVAHTELDNYEEITMYDEPGITLEEKASFQNYLDQGFIDTFRHFYPDKSFFSFWTENANLGFFIPNASYWRRMNYFLASKQNDFIKNIKNSTVLLNYPGTDHPPIKLELYTNNIH